MKRSEIKKTLLEIIKEYPYLKDLKITEESNLYNLGMDSLDKIELWMSIEEKFKKDIAEFDIRKCETVKDLIDLIER